MLTRLSLENYILRIWKVKLDNVAIAFIYSDFTLLSACHNMAAEQQHSLLVERFFVGVCRQYLALQLRHLVQLLCFCFWA